MHHEQSPDAPKVFFSIPFAGYRDDASWALNNNLLGGALRSVLAQTDPDFEVLVAGHEAPICPEAQDPRVTFLPVTFDKPEGNYGFHNDKKRKRRRTFQEVYKRQGGYVVLQDADDLVNRHLVAQIRDEVPRHGYVFKTGYVLNHKNGDLAEIPGIWRDYFNGICGTSAAVRLYPRDLKPGDNGEKPYAWTFDSGHTRQEGDAAAANRALTPLPFRGAVYVFNNSANESIRLRGDDRTRRICKYIADQKVPLTDALKADFTLDDVYEP